MSDESNRTASKPVPVGHAQILCSGYEGVRQGFARTLESIGWSWDELVGSKVFVKLNCMSGEVVPGTCTSPWLVRAVLESLRAARPDAQIWIGDGDGYSVRQVESYMANWGVDAICKEMGAEPTNLSALPTTEENLGPALGLVELPKLLLDMDCLIDLAVPKTHCLTGMTASLKNNWGLLPKTRYRYHQVVNDAIAEINAFFDRFVLAVADLTVSQDGPGPRCGMPRVCDTLLASRDRVALDSACADYMGLQLSSVAHIHCAEALGVGATNFEVEGDAWDPPRDFMPARSEDHPLYHLRDILARCPLTNALIFKFAPVYWLVGRFARFYNYRIWYRKTGRHAASEVVRGSFYEEEYAELMP